MDNRNGFTLIELLIALAIIAVMAAIGISSFRQYAAKSKLRAAAREIAADFTNYRSKAKSEGRIYTITFNASSTSNYIISAPAAGTLDAFYLVKTPAANASGVVMTGVDFTGCNTVRLTQRGLLQHCTVTPSPQNNTGTVSLINSQGTTAIVAVNTMVKTNVNFP